MKGERHSLPNRRTCIRAKSHETQRKRTKVLRRKETSACIFYFNKYIQNVECGKGIWASNNALDGQRK